MSASQLLLINVLEIALDIDVYMAHAIGLGTNVLYPGKGVDQARAVQ